MGIMGAAGHFAQFSQGAWSFFAFLGMDQHYFETARCGVFALMINAHYINGVHAGDEVTVHARVIARSTKRMHWLGIMVNNTQHNLTAYVEGLDAHANLEIRRTTPFPEAVTQKLDTLIEAHSSLSWQLPLSGMITP